jgi:hypothetical protein
MGTYEVVIKFLPTYLIFSNPNLFAVCTGSFSKLCRTIYLMQGMPSSGMLCLAALVTTDVSEERIASFVMVTRIGGLGTTYYFFAGSSVARYC